MHSGVPQGSVIYPLLFLLFVNELPDVIGALTLLFADDVKMATWDWSKKWDLPINPTKCNYLAIGRVVPLGLSFSPMGLAPPCIQISQGSKGSGR